MDSMARALREIGHAPEPAPRVYVDANIPARIVEAMRRDLGWDALYVVEHDDLRRATDRLHYARALELERTIVTQDKDFADAERFPPALSPGVLVCCVPDERWLLRCLRHVDGHLLRGQGRDPMPLRGRTLVVTPELCVGDVPVRVGRRSSACQ